MLVLCILVFLLCLSFPGIMGSGVEKGLLLTTTQVIPALYPFILLTTCFKYCITSQKAGIFSLVTAYFSGYPLGAKIVADQSSKNGGAFLQSMLLICNNPSPAYMVSYIGLRCFENPLSGVWIYLCILTGNLILGLLTAALSKKRGNISRKSPVRAQSVSRPDDILQTVILDSFGTVVTISSYVVAASVAAAFICAIPGLTPLAKALAAAALEMTTGAGMLTALDMSSEVKMLLLVPVLSFGGLSVIAQTQSMISGTSLSIKKYMAQKSLSVTIALFAMYIIIRVFKF